MQRYKSPNSVSVYKASILKKHKLKSLLQDRKLLFTKAELIFLNALAEIWKHEYA